MSPPRLAFGVSVVALALVHCLAPTEITLHVTTDARCGNVETAIFTSDQTSASAQTTSCDDAGAEHEIGDLVLVPSGTKDARVTAKVVTAIGRPVAQCEGQVLPKECIVARRTLRYLPHTPLRLEIPMHLACAGVACSPDETCVHGVCVNAEIDPNVCTGPSGCSEPDGGAGSAIDASIDASIDAPSDVPPVADAGVQIAAGFEHACARMPDGTVDCWGSTFANVPVPVALGAPATAVSCGADHSCAILSTGAVRCWGSNQLGQLGDGTVQSSATPVDVPLGARALQITAADRFTCAVVDPGALRCWGNNATGQLGDGTTTQRLTPTAVVGLAGTAIQAAGGYDHACAVLATGAVRCWGANQDGQLGEGNKAGGPAPVDFAPLAGTATQVAAGQWFTCAALTGGRVQCAGYDGYGQLGDGNAPVFELNPIDVTALGGTATQVAAGTLHACALLATGALRCWGANTQGEVGDGTTTEHRTPVDVLSLGGTAVQVVTGNAFTCALLSTKQVRCWGDNTKGQLGDGTSTSSSTTPVVVRLP